MKWIFFDHVPFEIKRREILIGSFHSGRLPKVAFDSSSHPWIIGISGQTGRHFPSSMGIAFRSIIELNFNRLLSSWNLHFTIRIVNMTCKSDMNYVVRNDKSACFWKFLNEILSSFTSSLVTYFLQQILLRCIINLLVFLE